MKRSLCLTNDYPPVLGGIATVFYNMWKHFPPDKMILATPWQPGAEEFDSASGQSPIRFRTFLPGPAGKILAVIRMFFIAFYHVLFRNVREIHAGQAVTAGPVAYFFQLFFGIPAFVWVYGAETGSAYCSSPLKRSIVFFLLRHCHRLVANSPTTKQDIVNFGIPEDKILVIYPAVDADRFTPGPADELRAELGLEGKTVLLTVARIVKRKGHDLVLRAMRELKDRDDLVYIIVGRGNDRPRLESLIEEYGLKGRVIFAGPVPDDMLPVYYRLCDIYVMPNREVFDETTSIEGFGISFIEAGAAEKPVIAGNSGGAVDAVADGKTGFIIDPEDVSSCAEKIACLLDNTETAKAMGKAGRERANTEFSWRTMAEKLAANITIGDITIR